MEQTISRRVLASRQNGRLGGLKTAETHTPEFLSLRASKAGTTTRDTYGNAYYSHIAKSQYIQGKKKSSREIQEQVIQEVTANALIEPKTTTELIQAAAKTLQM